MSREQSERDDPSADADQLRLTLDFWTTVPYDQDKAGIPWLFYRGYAYPIPITSMTSDEVWSNPLVRRTHLTTTK